MALSFSLGLKNDLLDTDSLKALLDDGFIRVYSGAVPADADASAGAAVELVTYSDNDQGEGAGQGLDFEANAASGAIGKNTGQTWSGTSSAAGAATFFRYYKNGDDPDAAAGSTDIRIQGTVGGAGADLFVASTAFADSTLYTIDYFSISIPL